MLNIKSFVAASAALTLVSGVSVEIVRRNEEPAQPSCTDFTPFVYAGCYTDPSTPERALLYDSNLNTQNMTVETCVAFCKGNDYKYAGLEYYGECFCGASVNGPQIDDSKCNYPCTGNSNEVCGGSDIISIYQDTTFPTVNDSIVSDFKSMGCYSEGTPGRSLAWIQDQIPAANLTVEKCLSACKDGGYSFAGVEYGQECYCGVVLGNGTSALPASSCDIPCTGDSSETCGGSSTLNLYVAKDMESTEPCNAPPPSSSSSSSAPTSTPTPSPTSSTTSKIFTLTSTSSSSASVSSPASSSTSSNPATSTKTSSSSASVSSPTSSSTSSKPTTSTKVSSSSSTESPTSSKPTSTILTTTSKAPITTSSSPPTTIPTTKTTASLCTSTIAATPTATCEYKCGNWCSTPLPPFSNASSCSAAVSACSAQVDSCFAQAGWPGSMYCYEYAYWCQEISAYCKSSCPGDSCTLPSCKSKYPPAGPEPTPSTSVGPCGVAPPTPSSTVKAITTSAAGWGWPAPPTTSAKATTTSAAGWGWGW